MGKEGEMLKSHARASAYHAVHHAVGAVDGESPTPKQASQPQPQTKTMTDAKMLQLVSVLEKVCNLRDRSLGTPVAARNVHSIDETFSAITEWACARVLGECEQEAGVAFGHGSTGESYTSSDGQRRHGGQTHTRPTAADVEHVAVHATTLAEDCRVTMAGPPGIPTARPTDPPVGHAMRAFDDPATDDAAIWRPVDERDKLRSASGG